MQNELVIIRVNPCSSVARLLLSRPLGVSAFNIEFPPGFPSGGFVHCSLPPAAWSLARHWSQIPITNMR
jgi:hypothetical protein